MSDGNLAPPGVYEHFIRFIQVQSSTGEDKYKTVLSRLKEIYLKVQDTRGQGFDNGSSINHGKKTFLESHEKFVKN